MTHSTKPEPKFISPAGYFALQDLSHDPKLAEALGNMVVAWAHAEIMLFATFARVAGIGLNMAMEASARIPTFESRTKFIRALIQEWNTVEFDKEAIVDAIQGLVTLSKTRNHWVHGDWCAPADKSHAVIFDHRAPVESPKRRKPVKAHDVMNHCDAVKLRAAELGKLIKYEALLP